MKHPPSQMIWDFMSKNGTTGLYFLATGITIKEPKYGELLKNKLLLHMTVHSTTIFMHDGTPAIDPKLGRNF